MFAIFVTRNRKRVHTNIVYMFMWI